MKRGVVRLLLVLVAAYWIGAGYFAFEACQQSKRAEIQAVSDFTGCTRDSDDQRRAYQQGDHESKGIPESCFDAADRDKNHASDKAGYVGAQHSLERSALLFTILTISTLGLWWIVRGFIAEAGNP
jgi:hypothetical protein